MTENQPEKGSKPSESPENTGFFIEYLPDFAAFSGFILLVYGCHLAWKPLGFIVAGLILLAVAIKGAQE